MPNWNDSGDESLSEGEILEERSSEGNDRKRKLSHGNIDTPNRECLGSRSKLQERNGYSPRKRHVATEDSVDKDKNLEDKGRQSPELDPEADIVKRRAMRKQIRAKFVAEGLKLSQELSTPTAEASTPEPAADIMFLSKQGEQMDAAIGVATIETEPLAVDYDAYTDDKARLVKMQHDVLPTGIQSSTQVHSGKAYVDVLDGLDDMFSDGVDVGKQAVKLCGATDSHAEGNQITAHKMHDSLLDSWVDTEGYYRIMIGELLDGRYAVHSILGKGVFSAVVRAIDQESKMPVAIKVIRNNDTMRRAGTKEIAMLDRLMKADPDDRKHIVRLLRHFDHRGHLCLVCESLSLNLREVLKKFGRNVGINLRAVRAYGQQMFLGLSLMRKCNVLHADLKPDNILVNESRNLLKICDLGSASDASENEMTAYLASRFYRAPEIILGLPYDFGIDVWSVGCTLFELYTGKILFPGRTNNQMLKLFMECRGKFPHKLIRKGALSHQHFDSTFEFNSVEKDALTGEEETKVLSFSKPTRDFRLRLLPYASAEDKLLAISFVDFLERCTELDPARRITATEGLRHPFLSGKQ